MVNEITSQIDDKISSAITQSSAQISQTILSQLVPFLTMDPTNQQHRQIVNHNATPIRPPLNHVPNNPPTTTQTINIPPGTHQHKVEPNIKTTKDIDPTSTTPDDMEDDPHSKKLKLIQKNHDLSESEDNTTDV